MSTPLHLLILEDRANDAELLASELRSAGFDPIWERVETEQDYLAHLSPTLDLILADYSLPQFDGLRALRLLQERELDIPFILVSGSIGEENAVNVMRLGAADYLLKDRLARIGQAVERALNAKQVRTEKMHANELLAKSQHRFRALIEHAPDGIALLGPDFELQYVSPSTELILGYSAQQVIGWDPPRFAHPDDLETFLRLLDDAIKNPGQSMHAHFRVRHRNDSWRWLEGTVTNLLDEQDVGAIVFNYRDVTARLVAAEQIRYQADLIEHVTDAIISTDINLVIQSWNRAAESIYGWRSDEVVGKHSIRLLATQQTVEESAQARKILFETGHWQGQAAQSHKNGSTVYILSSVSLVRDANENTIAIVAVNRDITRQTEAEAALAAREIKFQALIEKSAEGIVLLDAEGIVLYISPSTTRILGGAPGYWLGGNWLTRVHQEDIATVAELYAKLLQTPGATQTVQFRYQHLDRTWLWLEGTGTNLLNEPSVCAIVGNFRDVTARKGAEEATRRRLAELETINRISAALRTLQTVDAMLPMLLDESLQVLGTSIGSIWLYDANTRQLKVVAQRGMLVSQTVLERGQGIPGHTLDLAQPFISKNFGLDPRTPETAHPETLSGLGGACLPIVSGNDLSGVLYVLVESPRELVAEEIHLLMAVAEMGGNAIHRTSLNARTEQQVEQLAALRTVDVAISGSMDLNVILSILVEQVVSQLRVHAACVLVLDPYMHTIEYATGRGFRTKSIERSSFRPGEGLPGRAALDGRMRAVPDLTILPDAERSPRLENEDFVSYFGVPLMTKGRVAGVLEIFHREPLKPVPSWVEFLQAFAGQAAIAIENATLLEGMQQSNTELSLAYEATIEGWSRALDLRDRETKGHSERVADLTVRLAQQMLLSDDDLVHIRRGALLHDIGNMGIPDSILFKPEPLSDHERMQMQMHPVYAFDLLANIRYLRPSLDIPYAHHEKWDGTGYPRGLAGEHIPLAARIFAVVDVWDALCSDRPYRQAWSEAHAREYLLEQRGKHFDPKVVDAFLSFDRSS